MKVILVAVEAPLYEAFQAHCGHLEFVTVQFGSIFEVPCDAVVSPANSFGFMDGGIDALYSQYFGWHVEQRLQKTIREKFQGELLVGQAELVATDHAQIPWLIAAPTMRVPMILTDTVNPFLAARAALRVAMRAGIETIAFPGMGTGVGRVGPQTCALQLRRAIGEVLLGESRFPSTWAEASDQHQSLYTARPRNLQRDA